MMKRLFLLCLVPVVFLSCKGGDNSIENKKHLSLALTSLGAQKGNPNLCVLTNAPYVKAKGPELNAYLDVLLRETGCSEKKGSLLFFHRPSKSPLLTAVFHQNSGDCVVINPSHSQEKTAKFQINRDSIASEDFWVKARTVLDHSDAYSIVSILGSWWLDAPKDFLIAAERHGHVCPGLIFGYFMAKTVESTYPLRQGEAYCFVANHPTFCGNDAFRVVLGVTEEKETLFLKALAKSQKENWSISDGAGVLVRWNEQKKRGQGVILGIDMAELKQRTGFEKPSKAPEAMVPAVLNLIPYLNRHSAFVTVLWESSVEEKMFELLKSSEDNPYVVVGWR